MSPLRQLVQIHHEGLISQEEYAIVRTELLKKLEKNSYINDNDLKNFLNMKKKIISSGNKENQKYGFSDVVILVLGAIAAGTLAYILYS